MKRKFWNWIKNQDESGAEMRTLFLNGEISDETWYGDEVTPKLFKMSCMAARVRFRCGLTVLEAMYLRRLRFTTC